MSITSSVFIQERLKHLLPLILIICLAVAGLGFASFQTIHASGPIFVNSFSDDQTVGGVCSQSGVTCLREAIATAVSSAGGSAINFTSNGTITLTSSLHIDGNPANPVTIDGGGFSITIDGAYTGGSTGYRIMTIGAGSPPTVYLNHLILVHGNVSAGNGGAIENDGTLTITNCYFGSNLAQGVGGAVDNDVAGTAVIDNSTFDTNFVGNYGGAVSNEHTMTIANSTFKNNSTAPAYAITFGGAVKNSGTMNIVNSTFYNNYSGAAGAIINYGGSTTVSNSTISGNTADGDGGGVSNTGGTLNLFSDIIAGNTVTSSGTGPDVWQGSGANSFGYNLIGDGTGSGIVPATGDQIGTSGSPINPQLGPLQNNGGPTYTMATLFFSTAIGTGNCAGAPSTPFAPAVVQDQRGDNRKNTGSGLGCDIGAYESNPPANTATPTATNTATFTPTATATATISGTSTPTPGSGTPPAGAQIIIQSHAFNPNNLTVPVGTTVVWINHEDIPHTTTSDTGLWNSPHLAFNKWFAYTFTTVGDYTYHCAIYPTITGVIHVVNPTNTATATATPSNTATSTNTATKTSTLTGTPTSTATSTPAPRIDTIGIYRAGTFYLRLHNSTGNADLTVAFTAGTKSYPVVGDWTGAGFDTVGVFNQNNGQFTLCTANVTATCANVANQKTLVLGVPNDQPLSGHWALNVINAGVGVFRPSNGLIYLKSALTTGYADYTMVLGIPGDVGLAGDWNGKGFDSPGVYRPSNSSYYLSNQVVNGSVYGDYQFAYGLGGDAPVVGDWVAQGHDGVGLFRQSNGFTYLKNQLVTGNADNSFTYGVAGDVPVAGHWQAVYPPAPPPPVLVMKTSVPLPPANQSVGGDQPIGD